MSTSETKGDESSDYKCYIVYHNSGMYDSGTQIFYKDDLGDVYRVATATEVLENAEAAAKEMGSSVHGRKCKWARTEKARYLHPLREGLIELEPK